ncbi:MAG TPA: hemin uptake protein HemP [Pirellulales bacterium]
MTEQHSHSQPRPSAGPRQLTSEELLRGEKEIWIRHGTEVYRLRLTKSGKLILQK